MTITAGAGKNVSVLLSIIYLARNKREKLLARRSSVWKVGYTL